MTCSGASGARWARLRAGRQLRVFCLAGVIGPLLGKFMLPCLQVATTAPRVCGTWRRAPPSAALRSWTAALCTSRASTQTVRCVVAGASVWLADQQAATEQRWQRHNRCGLGWRPHHLPVRMHSLPMPTSATTLSTPAGNCVATGGSDGCLKLWDLRSGRLIQYYEAHTGAVTGATFHPSGNFLLSSSMDGTLKVVGVVWPVEVAMHLLDSQEGSDGEQARFLLEEDIAAFDSLPHVPSLIPTDLGPAGGCAVLHAARARGSHAGGGLEPCRRSFCVCRRRRPGHDMAHQL